MFRRENIIFLISDSPYKNPPQQRWEGGGAGGAATKPRLRRSRPGQRGAPAKRGPAALKIHQNSFLEYGFRKNRFQFY